MKSRHFFSGLIITSIIAAAMIFATKYWPLVANYQDIGWISIVFFILWSAVMFFSIYKKDNSKSNTFINAVMVFTMGKLMLSAILIIVYFKVTNPPSKIFIVPFFAVYLVYTIFETRFMMKLGKK